MPPSHISELAIEVTRKCNAVCKHCLRGDPQDISIREEYIERISQNISVIDQLTITGGEPSLAIQELEMILKCFRNIPIYNFYMATNGVENVEKLEWTLSKWHAHLNNYSCYFQVRVSNSEWHPPLSDRVKEVAARNNWVIGVGNPDLIAEGRGLTLADDADWSKTPEQYNGPVKIQGDYIGGCMHMNVFGYLIHGIAWSYESQDSGKHTIAHVFEMFPKNGINRSRASSNG